MEFKDRLKAAREALGLTQVQLAQLTGLSPGAIGNYESGERIPKGRNLEVIATAVNKKPDWLIGTVKKSIVTELLERLVDEGEIKNGEISEDLQEIILSVVKAEILTIERNKK